MSENTTGGVAGRVTSIDALRGFDMFWIMGADGFFRALFLLIGTPFFVEVLGPELEHSSWNGFTFYDLIFPLFLFIVGLTMPLSITRRLEKGHSRQRLYYHIIKRTVLLFVFGLIYNGLFDFNIEHQRWAGVLQRIALCYFFAAIIVMNTNKKGQAIWLAAILLVYWAIVGLVPVPGVDAGHFTPEGFLGGYLDRMFLPGRFCCYDLGDNEGFLSTIPAIGNVLAGVLTGEFIMSGASHKKKLSRMLVIGVSAIVLGWIWNFGFPVNKLMWTSSYVCVTVGWSLLLLSLFYWIIDVKKYSKWAFPFIVIGLNPITIYVIQGIFDFGVVVNIFVHGFIDNMGDFKQVFFILCVLVVKWLFLYFLYKQKIFLKV